MPFFLLHTLLHYLFQSHIFSIVIFCAFFGESDCAVRFWLELLDWCVLVQALRFQKYCFEKKKVVLLHKGLGYYLLGYNLYYVFISAEIEVSFGWCKICTKSPCSCLSCFSYDLLALLGAGDGSVPAGDK